MSEETKTTEDELKDALFNAKWAIDYWQKAMMAIPSKYKRMIEEGHDFTFNEAANSFEKLCEKAKLFDKNINDVYQKYVESGDALTQKIYDKHKEINKKMESIPKIQQPNLLNYQTSESLKTLTEVVQKISNLNEKDWDNLRKLSETFK